MKNFKQISGFLILLSGLLFTGCYTQVAMKDYDEERYGSAGDDEYYEEPAYSDTNYTYDDEYYEEDVNVSNYYYPGYRRYYWGYHPSISLGVYWGSYFYDPFCYDPFFYNYWCYPAYWSYYPYYRFHDYSWYYGYGHSYPGYWYGWDNSYRRNRTDDMYSVRNGMGGRNSVVTRSGSSLNRGTLTRTSAERVSSRERTGIESRSNTVRKRDEAGRIRNSETSRSISRDRSTTRERVSADRNTSPAPKREAKASTAPKRGAKEKSATQQRIERRKETERSSVRRGTSGTRSQSPKYTPPKRSSTPKSYSPPKRSSGGKSYSPPRSSSGGSYSPPRSSAPSRGSAPSGRSSGRSSGGNDSGRRR